MHEVFLQRLANHPVLRTDINFKIFLEYEQEVGNITDCFLMFYLTYRLPFLLCTN